MSTTPARPTDDAKETLPAWIIAFIVVDVLLVALAVWIGVSGGKDEPVAEPTASVSAPATTETPTDTPPPAIDPSAEGAKLVAAPSGNIACTLTAAGVECTIATLATEPAPVEGCAGTVGHVVELTANGVDTPCSPTIPGPASPGATVLEYGSAETVGPYTCTSTNTGMRCEDTDAGRGFVLARAGITTF